MKNIPPVFILGCPRSGTTILANLLEFSRYGKPFETHFITKYFKRLSRYGDLQKEQNFSRIVNDIANERFVMQWKVDVNPEMLFKQIENFEYSTIVYHICMLKSKKKGYQLWGDKTPRYTLDMDILYKLFPESKFIHIVRDGRDVALSLLKRPWGPSNIMSCAEMWKKYNAPNNILNKLKKNNQLFSLRYEDLLENAKEIVFQLYNFLGEEYHHEKAAHLIKKIQKGNYNKWQKKMSQHQIKLFENICAKTLRRFGYVTKNEEKKISAHLRLMYRLHTRLSRIFFLFKANIVDGIKIHLFGKEPFAE